MKCVKIKALQAIENWPESNLPTLFVYHKGVLQHQLMTLKSFGGGGRLRGRDLEWWLASRGIVKSELEEDPRNDDGGNEEEDGEDEGSGGRRGRPGGNGSRSAFVLRSRARHEEDEDD